MIPTIRPQSNEYGCHTHLPPHFQRESDIEQALANAKAALSVAKAKVERMLDTLKVYRIAGKKPSNPNQFIRELEKAKDEKAMWSIVASCLQETLKQHRAKRRQPAVNIGPSLRETAQYLTNYCNAQATQTRAEMRQQTGVILDEVAGIKAMMGELWLKPAEAPTLILDRDLDEGAMASLNEEMAAYESNRRSGGDGFGVQLSSQGFKKGSR